MSKIIAVMTLVTLCFSCSAIAKNGPKDPGGFIDDQAKFDNCIGFNQCQGGFKGPSFMISTVEQVKQMQDDQRVALKGFIIQSLGDENYLFKDDTGTIKLEIDQKRWRGQVITPNDLVEIQGKIDKDWNSIEVEVKHIIKVKPD